MPTLDMNLMFYALKNSFASAGYEVINKAENNLIVSDGNNRISIQLTQMLTIEQQKSKRKIKNINTSKRRGRYREPINVERTTPIEQHTTIDCGHLETVGE